MKVGINPEERKDIMKEFKVEIIEEYRRTVEIEAEDEDKAFEMVDEKVVEGEIDLPCDGGKYDYSRELYVNETNE